MATTTEAETTVQFEADGKKSEPMPMSEFEDRADQALDRRRQLSFDVGGKSPDYSSVKASIDLLIQRELRKGSEVRLQVIAADGELLATTDAKVIAVTFEDQYKDGFIVGTERVHRVKAV